MHKYAASSDDHHINILLTLTGTNCGQQKETILITYLSLIRFLFMYADPIWFPNTSPSLIQKLYIFQNSALRIATGSVEIISIDHLCEETKMHPVLDLLSLISSQYLARALLHNNPSHSVVTSPSGSRLKKNFNSYLGYILTLNLQVLSLALHRRLLALRLQGVAVCEGGELYSAAPHQLPPTP